MLLLPPGNFLLLFDEHLNIKLYRCVIVLLIPASEGERGAQPAQRQTFALGRTPPPDTLAWN